MKEQIDGNITTLLYCKPKKVFILGVDTGNFPYTYHCETVEII